MKKIVIFISKKRNRHFWRFNKYSDQESAAIGTDRRADDLLPVFTGSFDICSWSLPDKLVRRAKVPVIRPFEDSVLPYGKQHRALQRADLKRYFGCRHVCFSDIVAAGGVSA